MATFHIKKHKILIEVIGGNKLLLNEYIHEQHNGTHKYCVSYPKSPKFLFAVLWPTAVISISDFIFLSSVISNSETPETWEPSEVLLEIHISEPWFQRF